MLPFNYLNSVKESSSVFDKSLGANLEILCFEDKANAPVISNKTKPTKTS